MVGRRGGAYARPVLTVLFIATGVYAVVLIVFGVLNRGRGLSTGKAVAAIAATVAAGLAALWIVTVGARTDEHGSVQQLVAAGARAELDYWRRHRRFTDAVRLDLTPRSRALQRLLNDGAARLEVTELSGDGQAVILRASVGGGFAERTVTAPVSADARERAP
jgi:hypothetical protein